MRFDVAILYKKNVAAASCCRGAKGALERQNACEQGLVGVCMRMCPGLMPDTETAVSSRARLCRCLRCIGAEINLSF